MAPGPAAPAEDAAAPAKDAPTAACTRGERVDHFERSGDAAIACFRKDQVRDCWRIDAGGSASALPEEEWPPFQEFVSSLGDRRMPQTVGTHLVHAPASFGVKIWVDDPSAMQSPENVEVCKDKTCKRIKLRVHPIGLDMLNDVTVLDDHRTLFARFGIPAGRLLERYDLDRPSAAPQRIAFPGGCAEILDVLAGNVLVQMTGCNYASGHRLLMTPAGKFVANLRDYPASSPFYALGGDRWLFERFPGELAIWDLAKRKRLAAVTEERPGRHVIVIGGSIVAVDPDGKITGYDAALAQKPLGAIPRCP